MADIQNAAVADTSQPFVVTTTEECIMASSPDTSVTSTSFSEERNALAVAVHCAVIAESNRNDNDAEVTSSCEDVIIPEINTLSSFQVPGKMSLEENFASVEDIDSLQATLSPVDGELLADLTDSHHVAVDADLLMSEFCLDRNSDCSTVVFNQPVGTENTADVSLNSLTESNETIINLLQDNHQGAENILLPWPTGQPDATFTVDTASLLTHSTTSLTPFQQMIPSSLQPLEFPSDIDEFNIPIESSLSDLVDRTLAVTGSNLLPDCVPTEVSLPQTVTNELSYPFAEALVLPESLLDLSDTANGCSLELPFSSAMSVPSANHSFSESNTAVSLSSADGSALNDAFFGEELSSLLHTTRLNNDVMLTSNDAAQSVLLLSDDSIAMDTIDDLPLVGIDQPDGPSQKVLVPTDESFLFADEDWNCVQNWSSISNHGSMESREFENSDLANGSDLQPETHSGKKYKQQLRRSSRIQDNELRDLAQKIRQANQLAEQQELAASSANKGLTCVVKVDKIGEQHSETATESKLPCLTSKPFGLKSNKKSKIEYIDEDGTTTENTDVETVAVNTELELGTKQRKPAKRVKRFKSYTVTMSTDNSVDSSPCMGLLKIRLKKIDDDDIAYFQKPSASTDAKIKEISDVKALVDKTTVLKPDTATNGIYTCDNRADDDARLKIVESKATCERKKKKRKFKDRKDDSQNEAPDFRSALPTEPDGQSEVVESNTKTACNKVWEGKQISSLSSDACPGIDAAVEPVAKAEYAKWEQTLNDDETQVKRHTKQIISSQPAVSKTDDQGLDIERSKSNSTRRDDKTKISSKTVSATTLPVSESKRTAADRDSVDKTTFRSSNPLLLLEELEADSSKQRKYANEEKSKHKHSSRQRSHDNEKSTVKDVANTNRHGNASSSTTASSSSVSATFASCRGCNCQRPVSSDGVYCNDDCLQQHVNESLKLLSRERHNFHSQHHRQNALKGIVDDDTKKDERVVVFERSSGKLVTGPHAPTETTLLTWIRRHPKFEVVQPGNSASLKTSKKNSKSKLTHSSESIENKSKKSTDASQQPSSQSEVAIQQQSASDGAHKSSTAARQHVCKGLFRALSSRVPELSDASAFGSVELKRLTKEIEQQLCSFYGGVNSLYQRKYRALVSHLTNSSNKGLFRRVIYGHLKAGHLVRINSQLLGDEKWSQWPPEKQTTTTSMTTTTTTTATITANCCNVTVPTATMSAVRSCSAVTHTSSSVRSVASMRTSTTTSASSVADASPVVSASSNATASSSSTRTSSTASSTSKSASSSLCKTTLGVNSSTSSSSSIRSSSTASSTSKSTSSGIRRSVVGMNTNTSSSSSTRNSSSGSSTSKNANTVTSITTVGVIASTATSMSSTSLGKPAVTNLTTKSDAVSLLSVDSTDRHNNHVFDVNCRICMSNSLLHAADAKMTEFADRIQRAKAMFFPSFASYVHQTSDIAVDSCISSSVATSLVGSSTASSEIQTQSDLKSAIAIPSEIETTVSTDVLPQESTFLPTKGAPRSAHESSRLPSTDTGYWSQPHELSASFSIARVEPSTGGSLRPVSALVSESSALSTDQRKSQLTGKKNSKSSSKTAVEDKADDAVPVTEVIWQGAIVAQEVTTVNMVASRVSGSMKIMRHELPDSLTVMGRIPPEMVCDYIDKIRHCPVITREIAVVFFAPADTDNDRDGYDQLYKYLVERQRCAVFGSIGDVIKDMYIWPVARKSAVPPILLPFSGPGFPAKGRDILLGVAVQRLSSKYVIKGSPRELQHVVAHIPLEREMFQAVQSAEDNAVLMDSPKSPAEEIPVVDFVKSRTDTCITHVEQSYNPMSDASSLIITDVLTTPTTSSGDEPYEPMDEEDDAMSAPFIPADNNSSACTAASKVTTADEQLVDDLPVADTEMERFSTHIDDLLQKMNESMAAANSNKMVGLVSGLALVSAAKTVNEKQQMLSQLVNAMKEHIQTGDFGEIAANRSPALVDGVRLSAPLPYSATERILCRESNVSNMAPVESSIDENLSIANSSGVSTSESEMDKFLAWKNRLEGTGSRKLTPRDSASSLASDGSGKLAHQFPTKSDNCLAESPLKNTRDNASRSAAVSSAVVGNTTKNCALQRRSNPINVPTQHESGVEDGVVSVGKSPLTSSSSEQITLSRSDRDSSAAIPKSDNETVAAIIAALHLPNARDAQEVDSVVSPISDGSPARHDSSNLLEKEVVISQTKPVRSLLPESHSRSFCDNLKIAAAVEEKALVAMTPLSPDIVDTDPVTIGGQVDKGGSTTSSDLYQFPPLPTPPKPPDNLLKIDFSHSLDHNSLIMRPPPFIQTAAISPGATSASQLTEASSVLKPAISSRAAAAAEDLMYDPFGPTSPSPTMDLCSEDCVRPSIEIPISSSSSALSVEISSVPLPPPPMPPFVISPLSDAVYSEPASPDGQPDLAETSSVHPAFKSVHLPSSREIPCLDLVSDSDSLSDSSISPPASPSPDEDNVTTVSSQPLLIINSIGRKLGNDVTDVPVSSASSPGCTRKNPVIRDQSPSVTHGQEQNAGKQRSSSDKSKFDVGSSSVIIPGLEESGLQRSEDKIYKSELGADEIGQQKDLRRQHVMRDDCSQRHPVSRSETAAVETDNYGAVYSSQSAEVFRKNRSPSVLKYGAGSDSSSTLPGLDSNRSKGNQHQGNDDDDVCLLVEPYDRKVTKNDDDRNSSYPRRKHDRRYDGAFSYDPHCDSDEKFRHHPDKLKQNSLPPWLSDDSPTESHPLAVASDEHKSFEDSRSRGRGNGREIDRFAQAELVAKMWNESGRKPTTTTTAPRCKERDWWSSPAADDSAMQAVSYGVTGYLSMEAGKRNGRMLAPPPPSSPRRCDISKRDSAAGGVHHSSSGDEREEVIPFLTPPRPLHAKPKTVASESVSQGMRLFQEQTKPIVSRSRFAEEWDSPVEDNSGRRPMLTIVSKPGSKYGVNASLSQNIECAATSAGQDVVNRKVSSAERLGRDTASSTAASTAAYVQSSSTDLRLSGNALEESTGRVARKDNADDDDELEEGEIVDTADEPSPSSISAAKPLVSKPTDYRDTAGASRYLPIDTSRPSRSSFTTTAATNQPYRQPLWPPAGRRRYR